LMVLFCSSCADDGDSSNQDQESNSLISRDIYGIHAVDHRIVFAAGEEGYVYKTEDAWDHWEEQTGGFSWNNLYAIYAFDANNALAVGQSENIKKTEDGRNWVDVSIERSLTTALRGIYSYDNSTVFAVGSFGLIMKGTNRGSNKSDWTKVYWGPTSQVPSLLSVSPANNDVVWAVGTKGYIRYTQNGGGRAEDWIDQPYPSGSGDSWSYEFHGVAAIDERTAVAVGARVNPWARPTLDRYLIAKFTDGKWVIKKEGETTGQALHAVSAARDNKNVLWAVGENGLIMKSEDAGDNWKIQNSPTPYNLYAVSAVDTQTVFAAGHKGRILKTTDGGNYWKLVLCF